MAIRSRAMTVQTRDQNPTCLCELKYPSAPTPEYPIPSNVIGVDEHLHLAQCNYPSALTTIYYAASLGR
jgi:hypothetical protein